jgi:hypothetical protein
MDLGHIHEGERNVLYVIGWVALGITLGLTITGIWQLVYHEPSTALRGYVVGLSDIQSSAESTGVAALHALLGDAAAVLTLFGGAWFSVRVIYSFSWFSASTLVVLTLSLVTGGVIRFNASVHDGVVDVATRGYFQFFSGDAELAITDRSEIGGCWMVVWTVLHIVSIPLLVGSAWFTVRHSRRRRARKKARGPSWLDGLETKHRPSTAVIE